MKKNAAVETSRMHPLYVGIFSFFLLASSQAFEVYEPTNDSASESRSEPTTEPTTRGPDVKVLATPSFVIINPGENLTLSCRIYIDGRIVDEPLDTCRFTVAGTSYSMKQGKSRDGISYYGAGIGAGQCGIRIASLKEKHNGNMSCALILDSDPLEYQANIHVVVTVRPQNIDLKVDVGTDQITFYKETDILKSSCSVRNSRPAANLSWYLGNNIITHGLQKPVITCSPEKDLCSVQQDLTRTIVADDNNQTLRCVANHYGLNGKELVSKYIINVHYPPRPSEDPFEFYALVLGKAGHFTIMIEANPKPFFTWNIDGDTIYEGSSNDRFRVEQTKTKGYGKYESTLLIDEIKKEDTEKEFMVLAHNTIGEQNYVVIISTEPEPKVLEEGAEMIIFALLIIILILALIGICVCRAKRKLCFGVGDPEINVVSPNEGTENPAVNHHASSEYIHNDTDVKKEKPKEDTPV